ncbi:hypothetical protein CBP51_10810 [Cellvibrio mixtus]|uniref:Lysine-specific metallo-endopeptidase domain-containing protein n=1 Tax=Cellvibrio mixtus TaxID=39650 RepID=A0A266QC26_9GAMM|nr:hypothetical protein [Cellvibrio mixtus]OZY87438.1 hypothetical protein CBP51_10810 [Cellvibrio mixtus]
MAVKYCTGKRSPASNTRRMAHTTNTVSSRSSDAFPYQQNLAVQQLLQSNSAHSSNAVGTVSRRSSLPPNLHSAPADPRAVVDTADTRASGYLASASIFSFLDSMMLGMSMSTASSTSYQAYLDRFDLPEQQGARFRNRFSGTTYATSNEAQQQELESLSTRYENLQAYLDGGIRYLSNNTSALTIGGCRDRCSANPGWGAWTCSERSARAIALCPPFWSATAGEQATMIVHELAHMRYQIRNHNAGNARQRGSNPECYASYIADLFGFSSYSNQCPRV